MANRGVRNSVAILAVIVAFVAGCAANPTPHSNAHNIASIRGIVSGEPLELGADQSIPLRGTITCNGVSVIASADGSYTLDVPVAKAYDCTAASLPSYAPRSASFPGTLGNDILLNFKGNGAASECVVFSGQPEVECSELRLIPATVHGTVVAKTGGAVAHARVECQTIDSPVAPGRAATGENWPVTQTDAHGAYTLMVTHTGHVTCVAFAPTGDAQRQEVQIAPGADAAVNFQVCSHNCSAVRYHGGAVMHTYTAYLIFWLPGGYTFSPRGGDASFETLVQRYFRDVNGSSFYNLLTQYWDFQGYVENSVDLGGT